MLRQIANALGTEMADFMTESGKLQSDHEALSMLDESSRIIDQNGRQICIDFVSRIAQRHRIRAQYLDS